ncbi:hypothetical protein [Georgenia sp. AZ-5]|uniref:hypothetical protein n=1 Tax=Georgenia sp. AZ-5 TaxID=3367526 RepID=UPI003754574D
MSWTRRPISAASGVRSRPWREPPPLGPFRAFQVPIADVAQLTGRLDLGLLVPADRLATAVRALAVGGWVELFSAGDIRL